MFAGDRRLFLALASTLMLTGQLSAQSLNAQKKWAIVVGVNQYNLAPDLSYAVEDSAALASAFRSLGFDSIVLLNDVQPRSQQPTRELIESAIKTVVAKAKPSDLVVLAFSGHGVGIGGQSWLCPTEANLERPDSTMIAVDAIVNQMLECQARQRVLLFDACRNATPSADGRGVGVEGLADWKAANRKFVPKISPPRNQELALLASCDDQQESYEDAQLGHGAFTHCLLESLQGRAVDDEGYVEVSRLFTRVRQKTSELVRGRFGYSQTPVQSGYFGAIRLGRFTTLIDEDFSNVEVGGLPAGPWAGDSDVLVDFDIGRRKILCATGKGGWVTARGIHVNGEFELRCNFTLNSSRNRKPHGIKIVLLRAGEEFVPAITLRTLNTYHEKCHISFRMMNVKKKYSGAELASGQYVLKRSTNQPQIENELVLRRTLVRRGQQTQPRYQIIFNGDERNAISFTRPEVASFDQIGLFVESDGGNGHVQGIRRIQLMPVIGR